MDKEENELVDSVVEEVRADLLSRSVLGIKKYGKTLDRKDLNLADWLQHAYEEASDFCLYLKRAKKEILQMNLYKVRYFDSIQWRWVSYSMISPDEVSIKNLVDKELHLEFRTKPHNGSRDPEDSLTIDLIETIKLPFKIN